jgi:MFS family permease
MVGSTIIAIGAIIQAASYGVPQMMVGRIVAGLGTGSKNIPEAGQSSLSSSYIQQ